MADGDRQRDLPTVTAPEGGAPAVLPPGTALGGRYQIEELLGSGGMGHVYRATDRELAREVALKTMRVASEDMLARLRREVRLASRVTHENVIRLYDLVAADGVHFVTMELVRGVSLRAQLANGPLPVPQAVEIARQCARGLEAAHKASVVHRDFKPENVLLGSDGRVVVVDFGVASEQVDGVVVASAIVGTSVYMSPEQANGLAPTPATDLYALGLVLAEMLTGEIPLVGRGLVDTALRRRLEAVPSLRTLRPEVPEALDGLVRALLELEPEARPASAEVVAAALGGGELPAPVVSAGGATVQLEGTPTSAERPGARRAKAAPAPASAPGPRRRRLGWAVALGSAAVAAGLAALLWPRGDGDSGRAPTAPPAPTSSPPHELTESERCLAGDGRLCAELGRRALSPDAGVADVTAGVRLLAHACEKGVPTDCKWAADRYRNGEGVPKDPVRAMSLLEVGCKAGSDDACVALGRAHRDGWAGVADPARATELFEAACERSEPSACNDLGGLIEHKDPKRMVALYQRACAMKEQIACSNLAVALTDGVGVQPDLTRAAQLFRDACDAGWAIACYNLSTMYRHGDGVTKDLPRAAELLGRACTLGHGEACDFLGLSLSQGLDGMTRDDAAAVRAWERGCDVLGRAGACRNLGIALFTASGAAKDPVRASARFLQACDGGSMPGCTSAAWHLQRGVGVDRDQPRARALYQRACDAADALACSELAEIYARGDGIPASAERAASLQARACELDPTLQGCKR